MYYSLFRIRTTRSSLIGATIRSSGTSTLTSRSLLVADVALIRSRALSLLIINLPTTVLRLFRGCIRSLRNSISAFSSGVTARIATYTTSTTRYLLVRTSTTLTLYRLRCPTNRFKFVLLSLTFCTARIDRLKLLAVLYFRSSSVLELIIAT